MGLPGLGQELVCAPTVRVSRLLRVRKMSFLSIFISPKLYLCNVAILADPCLLGVIPDEKG
jgi:hypothetical protein